MEINPVSATPPPAPPVAMVTAPSKQAAAAAPTQPDIQQQRDSVHLSSPALAKSFKISGQTAGEIAKHMGVDIKTVDKYLGLAAKAAANVTALTGAAAAAAKEASAGTSATSHHVPKEKAAGPAALKESETGEGEG